MGGSPIGVPRVNQLIVLDNEAVQALGDPSHPKHRKVLSYAQVAANRKRRALDIKLIVPTAVRVEAGWDRRAASWAFANLLRINDAALDTPAANAAARMRSKTGVSVPDTHLGAVIEAAQAVRITVLTSDPADIRGVAGDSAVVIVAI